PEQVVRFKREQKARRAAGIDTPFVNARAVAADVAIAGTGGIRTRDSATVDPYRVALGIAAAAAARGAQIFERSPVRKVPFGRKWVEVHTAGGAIRARRVVVATGTPSGIFQPLARHFWFRTAYLVL